MVCRPLDTGHSTKNSCVKVIIFGSRFIFDIEEVGEDELSGLISDAILGDLKTQFLFQRLRNFENISGRGTLNPCSALLESEFENSRLVDRPKLESVSTCSAASGARGSYRMHTGVGD